MAGIASIFDKKKSGVAEPEAQNGSAGKNGAGKGGVLYRDLSGASKGAQTATGSFFQRRTVNGKALMVFTRQLASTLGSGLLLTESLDVIAEDIDNRYFGNVIFSIRCDVEGGSSLTQALAKYPRIFNKTFVAIVRSGEATGALHKTMNNLAKYIEETEKLKEKVVTATRYPLFILGFAILVVLVMVLFLIPKFADMFSGSGVQLPLLTRIVVSVSNVMIRFWWALPALIVGSIVFWVQARKFYEVRKFFDNLVLRLPVFGKEIFHKVFMSRFCRTLGFLLDGGVNVSMSLEIVSQVVSCIPIAEAVDRIHQRVVGGSEISAEIRRQKAFPALVGKMVSVGERTGRLPDLLGRTADYYDSELDHSLSRLTSTLEPLLIVFIGGVVLIVVLALYLPIFNMSKAIRG